MATDPGKKLDRTRLVVIVLFLIVGGLLFRTFFHNYVSEPARAAEKRERLLEAARKAGPAMIPPMVPAGPLREYVTTGDEQIKQRLLQATKKEWRDRHSLAIWGSLTVVCISIIIVVSVGLPMLLARRA